MGTNELLNFAIRRPEIQSSRIQLATTIMHSSSSQGGEKSGFDVFKSEFSKDVHFEVDVFWVKVGGVSQEVGIRAKGRISQLHLKDLKKGTKLPNFGRLSNDAFEN